MLKGFHRPFRYSEVWSFIVLNIDVNVKRMRSGPDQNHTASLCILYSFHLLFSPNICLIYCVFSITKTICFAKKPRNDTNKLSSNSDFLREESMEIVIWVAKLCHTVPPNFPSPGIRLSFPMKSKYSRDTYKRWPIAEYGSNRQHRVHTSKYGTKQH